MFEKIIPLLIILSIGFFTGLVYEILGPTIGELSVLYDTKLDKMIEIYTYRSSGYLIGSLIVGWILRLCNLWLTLGLFVHLCSITTCLIPYCLNMIQLFCNITTNGITSGVIDVITTIWILNYFKEKSTSSINVLHLCIIAGRTIVTLYTVPYINDKVKYTPSIESNRDHIELSIQIPFLITSGIGFLIASSALIIWRLYKTPLENYSKKYEKIYLLSNTMENIIFCLTLFLIALFSGMLILFQEVMVSLFSNSPLNITEAYVTEIKTYANVLEAISKVIYIFLLFFVSNFKLIFVATIIYFISHILLIVGFNSSLTILWIGNILYAIASGPLLPSLFSFFETFTIVTNYKGSLMIFGSSILAIIYPFIFKTIILTNPEKLLSFFLFSSAIVMFLLIIISLLINLGNKNVQQMILNKI